MSNVCAGTDFDACDQWSIPQVLNAAFKAHISEPGAAAVSLHPDTTVARDQTLSSC